MRPINLLPPYIYDKQKKRNLIIGWGAALAVVAGIFIWQSGVKQSELEVAKTELEEATRLKSQHDSFVSQIGQVQAKSKESTDRQTFIANSRTYNDAWPDLYLQMRGVTDPRILLRSMSLDPASHKNISLAGWAQTEREIVRWWTYLKGRADLFDTVGFTLPDIHAYAPQTAQNAAGGGGFGGIGGAGSGGGVSSPMMGGAAMAGGAPGSMGGGKMGGGAIGFGGPAAGGAGGNTAGVGPAVVENRQGFNFNAVAMLKEPLAKGLPTPAWGGAAAGPAAPGGFGGGMGGGMMGGSMGAPAMAPGPAAGAPAGGGNKGGGGKGEADE